MKQPEIIFATGNEGKMREIKMIMQDLNMEIRSMKEAGIHVNIVEDGNSFQENAMIKARKVWDECHQIVLADDSGLVIDYLDGEPGIYSARYMGEDTPYEIKNKALIERMNMAGDGKRSARFVCAIAAVLPDGTTLQTQGVMEGEIARKPAGNGGFGYDPILYIPEYGITSAELTAEQKNQISHRGAALRAMKEELRRIFGGTGDENTDCQ